MKHKEESGAKISHEGTISREAFVRAWSTGTKNEQGRMLFDLLGESVIARIRNIEENQRINVIRLDKMEDSNLLYKTEIQKDFASLEKRWAYIAGGIAVFAIIAAPLLTVFFRSVGLGTGVCP